MDSSIHIKDYPRTVVVDLENLDSESTDQTNSQTTREATKPTTEGKSTNEQFNEDSTMQADKSKSTNGGYTLLELQKHADRVKVSEDRKIAVTVKREFSDKTNLLTHAHVVIYGQSIVHGDEFIDLQDFDFELNSISPYSLAVNEDGSIIAIGLPSHGTNDHGEVRIWCRTLGSIGWKAWGVLDNCGKKIFGRNVGFDRKGALQVEYDIGYVYFDALSGLPLNDTQQQPDSDEFLEDLQESNRGRFDVTYPKPIEEKEASKPPLGVSVSSIAERVAYLENLCAEREDRIQQESAILDRDNREMYLLKELLALNKS